MKNLIFILLLAAFLPNVQPVLAENWVEFYYDEIFFDINKDSIKTGKDGYTYFTIRTEDYFDFEEEFDDNFILEDVLDYLNIPDEFLYSNSSDEYLYLYSAISCANRRLYYKSSTSNSYKENYTAKEYLDAIVKTVCSK